MSLLLDLHLKRDSKERILVIGESCKDVFVYGTCKRISPEAPVPVFTPLDPPKYSSSEGMAGNVVANLRTLSKDLFDIKFLTTKVKIKKMRIVDVDSNQQITRIDIGESKKLQELTLEEVDPRDYTSIIISDYNKGFLTTEFLEKLASLCASYGVSTFLDTKKLIGKWSEAFSLIKINKEEYQKSLELGNRKVVEDLYNKGKIIVTTGERGANWNNKEYSSFFNVQQVLDVSGAGDTFLAGLVSGIYEARRVHNLERFEAIEYGIRLANKAASYAVSQKGVVIVSRSDFT